MGAAPLKVDPGTQGVAAVTRAEQFRARAFGPGTSGQTAEQLALTQALRLGKESLSP